jgi:hypothetical protein
MNSFVMRVCRITILSLIVAGAGGLITLALWPSRPPVDVRVISSEPAQIYDDAGVEMALVTLVFSRPVDETWIVVASAEAEAKVAGRWMALPDTLSLGSLGGGSQTEPALILMPGGTQRCRIRLKYAGASMAWRVGGWLSRRGVKLPPRYWTRAGWPRAEGRKPHWKNASVKVPIGPFARPPAAML